MLKCSILQGRASNMVHLLNFLLIFKSLEQSEAHFQVLPQNSFQVLPVLKEYAEAGIMNKYGYEDYRAISMAIDVMQQEVSYHYKLRQHNPTLGCRNGEEAAIAAMRVTRTVLSVAVILPVLVRFGY